MTMITHSVIYASLALLSGSVAGFVTQPKFGLAPTRCSPLFMGADMGAKFFQLQEMEDKETSTTELFLHEDGRVDLFDTDGPKPESASGTWESVNEGEFMMRLTRNFDAGKEPGQESDIGGFQFSVDRAFTGAVSKVGGDIAVEGVMHAIDIDGTENREVGYFEMLDTTETRLGYEGQD